MLPGGSLRQKIDNQRTATQTSPAQAEAMRNLIYHTHHPVRHGFSLAKKQLDVGEASADAAQLS